MNISLFFTRGVSLELWFEQGIFDREKLIYESYLNDRKLEKVYWITYGCNDVKLSRKLKKSNRLHSNIVVVEMPKIFNLLKFGGHFYSLLIPFLHVRVFRDSDVIKTNQMDGAWSAVITKWIYRKPLLIRTGYSISKLLCSKDHSGFKCKLFTFIERCVYRYCDFLTVSSSHDCEYTRKKYNINKEKIMVLPNYISPVFFRWKATKNRIKDRILFIGRLNEEKNLFNLIEAVNHSGLSLDVYGQGGLEGKLKEFAEQVCADVRFYGVLPNSELAQVYSRYAYYILSSYHEGMPKTLLEAMASGCLCIGTDVPGISEIIRSGENGILATGTSANKISCAIQEAVSIDNMGELIQNAELQVKKMYSVSSISKKEMSVFKRMVDF